MSKKPKDAVASLRTAIAIDPDLPAAHYELGKALIQTNDMQGALAAFRRTTELLPEFASAWANLGAALGEMQQLDEAALTLRHAVALDPRSHALHSNLGVTYRDQESSTKPRRLSSMFYRSHPILFSAITTSRAFDIWKVVMTKLSRVSRRRGRWTRHARRANV